jgi:hypothetical protein
MNFRLRIALHASAEQNERLLALQRAFVAACNALAPIARQSGVWSRVGLHQLAYRSLRQAYPGLGSQMVCNAIYSVSRACRLVYQHPASPFCAAHRKDRGLPLLHFAESAPVYFDRHTLSLRDGTVSMFTLDGRMRFSLPLSQEDERRFHEDHLLEIMLSREGQACFLQFSFGESGGALVDPECRPAHLPDYLVVQDGDSQPHSPPLQSPSALARASASSLS